MPTTPQEIAEQAQRLRDNTDIVQKFSQGTPNIQIDTENGTLRPLSHWQQYFLDHIEDKAQPYIDQLDSKVTAASDSASAASTSASNAANSETEAKQARDDSQLARNESQSAKQSAVAAKNQAEAIFQQFGDQYLGPKASDPTEDNSGNPLTEGDVYFNTTDEVLKFYSGASWVSPESIATDAASQAQTYRDEAQTAETNASDSATAADNSESAAASSESAASSSATTASQKASDASASASSASSDATTASQKASAASTSASDAASSATTAGQKATAASNSADAAAGSATEAQGYADQAANSVNESWDSISGKPDTATRWPTYQEVTGTPDPSDYATAAQGAKADSALQPSDVGTAASKDASFFATQSDIGDIASILDNINGGP